VISEETAAAMRRLLVKVVESGTGKKAAVPGFTVAGKTGTAQKAIPGVGYSSDRYVGSFFGFLPADRPRVVIGVLVDEPHGKTYGGDVAAPVFSVLGAEMMRLYAEPGVPPADRVTPTILTADLSRGAARLEGEMPAGLVPAALREGPAPESPELLAPGERIVPDLAGRPAREAVQELAQRGFTVKLAGHGFVVGQQPAPGTALPRGSAVRITLSFEPPVDDARLEASPSVRQPEVLEP